MRKISGDKFWVSQSAGIGVVDEDFEWKITSGTHEKNVIQFYTHGVLEKTIELPSEPELLKALAEMLNDIGDGKF